MNINPDAVLQYLVVDASSIRILLDFGSPRLTPETLARAVRVLAQSTSAH